MAADTYATLPAGERTVIPARGSRAFLVRAGQLLRIFDQEGEQVADVYWVAADDPADSLSGIVTTQFNKAVYLTTGHVLYTERRRPAFTIVDDTAGPHDVLMGACSQASYLLRYGAQDHPNCQDLLQTALAEQGVHRTVADTFNAFMNVPVGPDGKLTVEVPRSKAGDSVTLRAEMDCLVAISSCPADLSACNGWNPTSIGVEVGD
jgi:uncharacterized protein YcgI (DUF1989 family)